ncbi:hypothetical protein DVB87_00140 [Tsukamurella tyrosinosolvens]|nr:hypothetical protein DVB87_00140 [Tsukamurella tyrosinosolvens]
MYRRPFTNGTAQVISQGPRFKLPKQWIDELDADLRSAHEEILEWANLQVAHHIGLKETYQVDALVNPDGMDRGFASTIVSHTIEILPDPKLIRALQTLSVRFAEKSRGLRMEKTIQQREALKDADVNDFYDDPKKFFAKGKRGPRFNS